MKKICSKCKIKKEMSLKNFSPNKKREEGFSSWCHICKRKIECVKKWIMKNKEKSSAIIKLNYAVRKGKIKRGKCKICDTIFNIDGHHIDYSKPLEVIWLCHNHHKKLHAGIVSL